MKRARKEHKAVVMTSHSFPVKRKDFVNSWSPPTYVPVLVILGIFIFLVLASIWSQTEAAEGKTALTLTYVAFFLGTVLELRRIAGDWSSVALTMGLTFIASLLFSIIPHRKKGDYASILDRIQSDLRVLPLVFAFMFLAGILAQFHKKLTARLGEGTTLLHSLTLCYFLLEQGWPLAFLGGTLGFTAMCYSVTHALSKIEITPDHRLGLSLWSSLTMTVFGVVYVREILQMGTVDQLMHENQLWDAVFVFFKYLLLGSAGPYIAQNFVMLLGYLPEKPRQFLSEGHLQRIKTLNQSHIDRYSVDQIDHREAIAVLVLAGGGLLANLSFKFVAPTLAIWLCFAVVPPLAVRLTSAHRTAR